MLKWAPGTILNISTYIKSFKIHNDSLRRVILKTFNNRYNMGTDLWGQIGDIVLGQHPGGPQLSKPSLTESGESKDVLKQWGEGEASWKPEAVAIYQSRCLNKRCTGIDQLSSSPWDCSYYYPHLTDEEMRPQRVEGLTHSQQVEEVILEFRQSDTIWYSNCCAILPHSYKENNSFKNNGWLSSN